MKKETSANSGRRRSALFSIAVLSLAGSGQFFLAQKDQAPTVWLGLFFYAAALFFLFRLFPKAPPRPEASPEPSPAQEGLLFFLVLVISVFFRAAHLHEIPSGVFADRAEVACGALRILQEGWRPGLEALNLHIPEIWIYYLTAGWFKLFGADPLTFGTFDAFLSVLGLVFVYGFFRKLAGPKAALLAFFFLSVMRWNFVFGRGIYFQSQTVLFLGLTLWFLLFALHSKKMIYPVLGGICLALGLYSYQALKALPLLVLAYFLFELWKGWGGGPGRLRSWAFAGLTFLLAAAPLIFWSIQNQSLGRRDAEVSVLLKIQEAGNLKPLLVNLADAAGMFSREGDHNTQSNFQARRMLDDVTSVFFILGLGYAFWRIRERKFFYAAAGLMVMSLPAVLSTEGAHAGRMLGATPFVALLAALLLSDWSGKWEETTGRKKGRGIGAWGFAACLLAAAGFQNYRTYFSIQAVTPSYLNDFSWEENKAAKTILGTSEPAEFFLSSRFYGHPTVRYLALSKGDKMHPWDLASPPSPGNYPAGSDFYFFLDEFKSGTMEFLRKIYPGGRVEAFENPLGRTLLYAYHVSAGDLASLKRDRPLVARGLYGTYRQGARDGVVFLRRWDPLVNFTFRDLPATSSALSVHWAGRFFAPQEGVYSFLALTYEDDKRNQARLTLDRDRKTEFAACPNLVTRLSAGWHQVVLDYRKPEGPLGMVHLLWKKPGDEKFEFMPNDAFGPIR